MSTSQYNTRCIYRIICTPSQKSYIGQTCNPQKRIYEHFRLLKLNQHYNQHLQNAFNQFGDLAFHTMIIESDIDPCVINDRERYWINQYDSFHNGFNKSIGGDLSYLGKPCEWNGNRYSSLSAAAFDLGISTSTLSEYFNRGYLCSDDIPDEDDQRGNPCVWNGILYRSQKIAATALGISQGAMKFRVRNGYTCDSDMPQRTQCTWNGVVYRSISKCSKATGIPQVTLSRWIRNGIVCDKDRPIYRKISNVE